MRLARIVLLALLTLGGVFGVVRPAWAHTALESSSPAEGASLSTPPSEVTLTFGEAVTLPANPISVTGPDGASWTVGEATVAGPVVTAPVTATGAAGAYVLKYRVTADDGHNVAGTVHFTLPVPAGAVPASAAVPGSGAGPNPAPGGGVAAPTPEGGPLAPNASSGAPAWVWVLLVVALISLGAAAAVARSRRA